MPASGGGVGSIGWSRAISPGPPATLVAGALLRLLFLTDPGAEEEWRGGCEMEGFGTILDGAAANADSGAEPGWVDAAAGKGKGRKVEPRDVVLTGVCSVQTDCCTARQGGAITAVWGPPGRTQINVCGACLEEKIRVGAWQVEGARLRQSA